jgi:hypothetical protein
VHVSEFGEKDKTKRFHTNGNFGISTAHIALGRNKFTPRVRPATYVKGTVTCNRPEREGGTRGFQVYEGTKLLQGEMDDQKRQDMVLGNDRSPIRRCRLRVSENVTLYCHRDRRGDLIRNIVLRSG